MMQLEALIPEVSDNVDINVISSSKIIITHLDSRNYIEINNETFKIFKLIDGRITIDQIVCIYNSDSNIKINESLVYNLIYKKLGKYGIIKGATNYNIKKASPNYLSLSFIIFNEKFLNNFIHYFYIFFNKKIFISVSILYLILVYYSIYYLKILNLFVNLNYNFSIFLLLMVFSVTFHEIGHASAAKHFGARHGGIGGGFYLLKPVYYADVTDIWRLSIKKRIVVNLAGIYFEIIFCCLICYVALLLGNNVILLTNLSSIIISIIYK